MNGYQSVEEFEHEIELSDDYIFSLCESIEKISIDNYYIVLHPLSGIFIVLFNNEQNEIFESIKNKSIKEIRSLYNEADNDLNYVIMSIFDSGLDKSKYLTIDRGSVTKSIFVYLTDKCNLSCLHCYRNNDTLHKDSLFLEQWKNIFHKFKLIGGCEVTISGGEPLLFKEIVSLISYIKSLGLKLTILSNGILWMKRFFDHVDVLSSIDEIQISLDGFNEESHSLMRGEGNFEKVIENIYWLKRHNQNVSIAVTISPQVINNQYNDILSFLDKLKEDFLIRITQKILPNSSDIHVNDDSYYAKVSQLSEAIYPGNNISKWMSVYWNELPREDNCGWGNLTINAIGDVYTCNRTDKAKKIGNILVSDIENIVKLGENEKLLTSVDNIYPCKNCSLRFLCNGGCRIDDFVFYDNMAVRDCSIENKRKKYINMIKAASEIYGVNINEN